MKQPYTLEEQEQIMSSMISIYRKSVDFSQEIQVKEREQAYLNLNARHEIERILLSMPVEDARLIMDVYLKENSTKKSYSKIQKSKALTQFLNCLTK